MTKQIKGLTFSIESLLRDAEHLEGCGAGNEAAAIRWAVAEIKRLSKIATDRRYEIEAMTNMLGPNGLAVVKSWRDRGVTRMHFDWGPSAAYMSGEERAAVILSIDEQVS